jgi:hypothetical protein
MAAVKLQLDAATIEEVILHLNHFCLRGGMYFGNPTLIQADAFIAGFRLAIHVAFDDGVLRNCRDDVIVVRGYKTPNHRVPELYEQIQDRFPEEADRAIECVTLELEAWKRLREMTA